MSDIPMTLHQAVLMRDFSAVDAILDRGASPNSPDQYGALPLISAIKLGESRIALRLIAGGASVVQKDFIGETSLLHACLHGDQLLIEAIVTAAGQEKKQLLSEDDYDLIVRSPQAKKVLPILKRHGISSDGS